MFHRVAGSTPPKIWWLDVPAHVEEKQQFARLPSLSVTL